MPRTSTRHARIVPPCEAARDAVLEYFSQYAKVRVSYRGDFFVSMATSFAATIFSLGFLVMLFQKIPQLTGWRFEEVLFL